MRTVSLLFLTASTLGCAAEVDDDARRVAPDLVELQILNLSDWHGQLDPVSVGSRRIGGAAVISAYWKADRAANPNTLSFTAGDAFGATPPLSNFFDDEPAVRALNLMGLDADTLGNHNFDRGIAHLQRMIDLAGYRFVSANLANVSAELDGVARFALFEVGGVTVGVVGVTNPEAATLVKPGAMGTIAVTDPVSAANQARAQARASGAKVLVALTHLGVTGFDAAGNATGPLIDFADAVGGFDLILGDHTDIAYTGIHNNALVVEANSKGVSYGRTTLTVDRANGRVVARATELVTPDAAGVTPDPAIDAMLAPYRAELTAVLRDVVGASEVPVPRTDSCGNSNGRICESKVGNAVTDALRVTYGTDFALTNSGGLRAGLTCPANDDPNDFCDPFVGPPYPITKGQVFTVLPFGNEVVTLTVTGDELRSMLENGVSAMPGVDGRFAQVSGLCFTYDIALPPRSRVIDVVRQAADGSCTGEAVDVSAAAVYTLAANDFIMTGGDGYANLGHRMTSREMMDQVVSDWVAARGTIAPAIEGRVRCVTSGTVACPAVTLP
jgi:2',3'-cyclic-nucleotide 2'-phosphodiesterase (5'-nucleotidase family)